jgi:hypothetical protein
MKYVQLTTTLVYALIAFWYIVPQLKKLALAQAVTLLLWVHVFRYVVVYLFTAQREGYPISAIAALQLVIGDLAGAAVAAVSIILLRLRLRLGLGLAWLVVMETIVDAAVGVHQRLIEPPRADAAGVWWLVFTFFAPLILVSLPLLTWQLFTRRREPLMAASTSPTREVARF